jgi:phenylalanyl-tRNA synthetase beta chain
MLAICDADTPVALAGVMGGEGSEVTEATTDLLLECALFTPGPIRATRKAIGVSTDSSYRFERGVDPEGMVRALFRAARLIAATAGGKVEGPVMDCAPRPFSRDTIALRPERVEKLLGIPFAPTEIRSLLEPLGFQAGEEGGAIQVGVPGFRSYDVTREVDLIEEIARRHGFDSFPAELGAFRPGVMQDDALYLLCGRVREHLASRGLFEAQTPAFAPAGEGTVELQNPLSAEEGVLRGALLPGLIRRVEYNAARGNRDIRLFEIGTVFETRGPGELPYEETRLSLVLHGRRNPPHWSGPDIAFDLWDLKGLMEGLIALPIEEGWTVQPLEGTSKSTSLQANAPVRRGWTVATSHFDPNASFAIRTRDGGFAGIAGPLLAGKADLPPWGGTVWAAEIGLPAAPTPRGPLSFRAIPSHPGVERDLALLLPQGVTSAALLALARKVGGGILKEIGVFDVYRDRSMPSGVQSVAIRLRFRADDRTLKDLEVDEVVQKITGAFQEELHVGIRSQKG